MKLVLAAVLAMGLVALAGAARQSPTAPSPAIAPDQLTAVQQIRARIEQRAQKSSGPGTAYTVTIPSTTVSYQMVPVPAGEFLMGSTGPGAPKQEQPPHTVRVGCASCHCMNSRSGSMSRSFR